jgi:hypothetical protein
MKLLIIAILILLGGCAVRGNVDRGQALFFNETFAGNGRTCLTCHQPAENFSISPETIAGLPGTDPLFVDVAGLEDPVKLRADGLILIADEDEDQITEFRQTPKLTQLQALCNKKGDCVVLGLRGDRETNLCQFSNEAIANHLTKDVERIPGRDFRLLTKRECKDLTAYLISDRVAKIGK